MADENEFSPSLTLQQICWWIATKNFDEVRKLKSTRIEKLNAVDEECENNFDQIWKHPNGRTEDLSDALRQIADKCARGEMVAEGLNSDGTSELISNEVWFRSAYLSQAAASPNRVYLNRNMLAGEGQELLASLYELKRAGMETGLSDDLKVAYWIDVQCPAATVLKLWKPCPASDLGKWIEGLLKESETVAKKTVWNRCKAEGRNEKRNQVYAALEEQRGKRAPGRPRKSQK